MKKIALCGFMGCGKTTVATSLSQKFDITHIDTDEFVEQIANMCIKDMFSDYGEDYFREQEYQAIKSLAENGECLLLALGGGAVQFGRNVNVLKDNGYTLVFLDTDFEVVRKRLLNDSTRPLLKTNDIKQLYEKRYNIYLNACDVKITCFDESGEEVAQKIIDSLD